MDAGKGVLPPVAVDALPDVGHEVVAVLSVTETVPAPFDVAQVAEVEPPLLELQTRLSCVVLLI